MLRRALQDGQHWKGYIIRDDELVVLDFPEFKCDPGFGIINGRSTDGQVANGVIKRNGEFQFTMQDEDYNVIYCWGKMSHDHSNIQGTYGIENFEADDQFKLSLIVSEDEIGKDEEYNSEEYESIEAEDDYEQEEEEEPEVPEEDPEEVKPEPVKKQKTKKTVFGK